MTKFFKVIFWSLLLMNFISCRIFDPTSDRKLQKIVDTDDVVFVDVRTPREFSEGSLENAKNIPVDSIENQLDFFKNNADKEMVVFCKSGKRAAKAKKILRKNSIKNVHVGTSAAHLENLKNE